mgnify:CR=1 FL=1
MRFKSLSIFLIISSFFLTCILSIWKIMSTLQGLNFTNLNISQVFLIGILLSLSLVLISNKINHLIKIFSLSFLFSILYFYLNETSPYWYIIGVFLITLFFTNKLKKYSMQSLKEDFISKNGKYRNTINKLIKLSSEHENLYVFDSLDVMCPNSECKYTSEGKSFYSDIHHLSNYSVRYLIAPKVINFLKEKKILSF